MSGISRRVHEAKNLIAEAGVLNVTGDKELQERLAQEHFTIVKNKGIHKLTLAIDERRHPEPAIGGTAALEILKEEFPSLGLTFGYIGNVGREGDHRSWRFFTTARAYNFWGTMESLSVSVPNPQDIDFDRVRRQLSKILTSKEVTLKPQA